MSEEVPKDGVPAEAEAGPKDSPDAAADARIRRITRITGALVVLSLLWYLAADRFTPWTSVARVSGYVVPIVPEVSGKVTDVRVALNQRVAAGDVLVQIDPRDYVLAVERAEAELARAGESIGADTSGVASARAKLAQADAELAAAKRDRARIEILEAEGVTSTFRADNARSRFEKATAARAQAAAELERARSQLGSAGADNPRIREASAALATARLDLEQATLRAPTDGGVTNVRVEVGQFAAAGQPLMTFISSSDAWVEAYLRENSIGNVKPGDRVEIVLDVAPGRVFQGAIASTGFGVDWGRTAQAGKLPSISNPSDWLREPQRFPVVIRFTDDASQGLRREGGQADVMVYTEGGALLRPVGWLWIRLLALTSYAY